MIDYRARLAKTLAFMGNLYTVDDLLAEIDAGRMQSFAHGDSWIVTQVNQYPRGRTLDWTATTGDLDDGDVLHERILNYARDLDIPLVRAYGRKGWVKPAAKYGWRVVAESLLFHKDI